MLCAALSLACGPNAAPITPEVAGTPTADQGVAPVERTQVLEPSAGTPAPVPQTQVATLTPVAVQQNSSTAHYAPGAPAIAPQEVPTDATMPAITPEQAAQYVLVHGVDGKIGSSGQLTVVQALCASAAKIRRWIGTTEGRPDDAPLCLVQVRGQFSVAGAPGAPSPAVTGSYAQVLFDGRTGNLLMDSCCTDVSPSPEAVRDRINP